MRIFDNFIGGLSGLAGCGRGVQSAHSTGAIGYSGTVVCTGLRGAGAGARRGGLAGVPAMTDRRAAMKIALFLYPFGAGRWW